MPTLENLAVCIGTHRLQGEFYTRLHYAGLHSLISHTHRDKHTSGDNRTTNSSEFTLLLVKADPEYFLWLVVFVAAKV